MPLWFGTSDYFTKIFIKDAVGQRFLILFAILPERNMYLIVIKALGCSKSTRLTIYGEKLIQFVPVQVELESEHIPE